MHVFFLPQEDPKLWYGIGILYDRYGSLDPQLIMSIRLRRLLHSQGGELFPPLKGRHRRSDVSQLIFREVGIAPSWLPTRTDSLPCWLDSCRESVFDDVTLRFTVLSYSSTLLLISLSRPTRGGQLLRFDDVTLPRHSSTFLLVSLSRPTLSGQLLSVLTPEDSSGTSQTRP
jgi:hypothetical protein